MNSFKEKINVAKIYDKCNKLCPFCFKPVTLSDIYNNNYVYSETKRKSRLLAHRICVEREIIP